MDGVGLKREQFTMRMSMSFGFKPVLFRRSSARGDRLLPRSPTTPKRPPWRTRVLQGGLLGVVGDLGSSRSPLAEDLLNKTGLKPKDIDILIVNCSLFNPTPSMTAMIINHYGMRTNIQSYNLSGMGCSA